MRTNIDHEEAGAVGESLDRMQELLEAITVTEDGHGAYYIDEEDVWRLNELKAIVEDNLEHVFDAL